MAARHTLYFTGFGFRLSFPAVHLLLRQSHLREDTIDVLRDQIVNRLRLVIERWDRRHDYGAGLLHAQHVLQMNPAEWRIAHAEHQAAAFLEANIGGARDQVVAGPGSDTRKRSHRAG